MTRCGARANPSAREAWPADHSARTVPCTASVGCPAGTAAHAVAAATAPPGGAGSQTRPIAWARRAGRRSAVPISTIRAAVVGVPGPRLGQVGRAYVVRRQDATLTSDDLIAWSRREMANCKVPRSVVFVRGLPRNAGGKVVKARLGAAGRD